MAKRIALSYIRYINIPKKVCSLFVLTMNPLNALTNLLVDWLTDWQMSKNNCLTPLCTVLKVPSPFGGLMSQQSRWVSDQTVL